MDHFHFTLIEVAKTNAIYDPPGVPLIINQGYSLLCIYMDTHRSIRCMLVEQLLESDFVQLFSGSKRLHDETK